MKKIPACSRGRLHWSGTYIRNDTVYVCKGLKSIDSKRVNILKDTLSCPTNLECISIYCDYFSFCFVNQIPNKKKNTTDFLCASKAFIEVCYLHLNNTRCRIKSKSKVVVYGKIGNILCNHTAQQYSVLHKIHMCIHVHFTCR